MAEYLTEADLYTVMSEAELVQMADDAGTGLADPSVIAGALADAEAEVNAYLQERYTLPLAVVPALVKRVARDVAVWNLYSRRKLTDEVVRQRYQDAVRLLEKISSGQVSLGVVGPPPESAPSGVPQFDTPERLFTRDHLKGF